MAVLGYSGHRDCTKELEWETTSCDMLIQFFLLLNDTWAYEGKAAPLHSNRSAPQAVHCRWHQLWGKRRNNSKPPAVTPYASKLFKECWQHMLQPICEDLSDPKLHQCLGVQPRTDQSLSCQQSATAGSICYCQGPEWSGISATPTWKQLFFSMNFTCTLCNDYLY